MEIRVLGPVEVADGTTPIHVGGPRQQITLAMLALHANLVTPVNLLVDAVWGDKPPTTARSQIQICVSALRRVLADAGRPDAILTRTSGYLLDVGPDELDLARFTSLVAAAREHDERGRPAAAAEELTGALALWRGPALLGVTSDLVQREAALLNEHRLAAIEDQMRLALRLGRHEEVIGDLFDLVDKHPFRERLHGSLMLALYRCGRQAEALECYRRMRMALSHELGLEPSRDLQELEFAILNRDDALRLPDGGTSDAVVVDADTAGTERAPVAPRVPRQLPACPPDFIGRDAELTAIREHLTVRPSDAIGGSVRMVTVTGKAGVGKSALAIRAAHLLAPSFPDGQLYAGLDSRTGPDAVAAVISQFLRALGVPGHSVPEDPAELAALYRSRLADQRILVVLDGVDDEATVNALLPGSGHCAVIVSSRSRLTGVAGALRVNVEVMEPDQSVELLCRIAGRRRVEAEIPAALELAAICAGLPLALRIAGARLASRTHWPVAKLVRRLRDQENRLDEFAHGGMELRSTIGLAHSALGERARRLFRLLALLRTGDFAGWTAAVLLETDYATAEDILEELVDAQLLDVVAAGGKPVRYAFHDLIRVYACEQLCGAEPPEVRRRALRRVLGGWLTLAREAHRHEYGGDYTLLLGDTELQPVPAEAVHELAEDPISWWETERHALASAVRQAAEHGHTELSWELALTSVTLYEARGYFDDWRETSQVALRAAAQAGNRRGIAAMRYSLGTLHLAQKRLTEASEDFDAALGLLDDEYDEALVLRNLAYIYGLRGDDTARDERYRRALRGLRQAGDHVGEAHVLYNMAGIRLERGGYAEAQEMLDAALAICQRVRCLRVEAQVTFRLGELHLRSGDLDRARRRFEGVLRIVRETDDRIGKAHVLHGLATAQWSSGRADLATATFAQALTAARRVGERLIEGKCLYALGEMALDDAVDTALTHLGAALALFEDLGATVWEAKVLCALEEAYRRAGNGRNSYLRLVPRRRAVLERSRATQGQQCPRLVGDVGCASPELPSRRRGTSQPGGEPRPAPGSALRIIDGG
ncbi:tetratricopeptide repeat protein [Micromonospora sp. C31]|uniref:AfsR/SARP family transcriptional regulator n=1 Tax=Micromonospora sp. C31 TaxID=2824876 RepID=UPI001B383637|nr:BTAD domain-containing putative transcriptional regulator [Micromonospora sp. C31]MBQ1076223.1 tetratricopeptide repeat protein [Micromonospora sp. C31]